MLTAINPAIEHIVVRAADGERVRSDTASVVERADGTLLVAYHSYSHGPEGVETLAPQRSIWPSPKTAAATGRMSAWWPISQRATSMS